MSFITRYGSIFGTIPPTTGRLYFVAPAGTYVIDGRTYSSSDNNDGLSPERALATIAQFVTNASASQGDTAILLEGTHTLTSVVNISKAGLTILGVHSQYGRQNFTNPKVAISAIGSTINIFNVTSNNFELGYVTMIPANTLSGIVFGTGNSTGTGGSNATGVDGLYVHDCLFRMGVGGTDLGTVGINFGYRSATANLTGRGTARLASTFGLATAYIENCVFRSDKASGPAIDAATCNIWVKGCRFVRNATWTTQIMVATNASSFLLEDAVFMGFGGSGLPIDGTSSNVSSSLTLKSCSFDAKGLTDRSKPLDNFSLINEGGASFAGGAMIGNDVNIMTATGVIAVTVIT